VGHGRLPKGRGGKVASKKKLRASTNPQGEFQRKAKARMIHRVGNLVREPSPKSLMLPEEGQKCTEVTKRNNPRLGREGNTGTGGKETGSPCKVKKAIKPEEGTSGQLMLGALKRPKNQPKLKRTH